MRDSTLVLCALCFPALAILHVVTSPILTTTAKLLASAFLPQ